MKRLLHPGLLVAACVALAVPATAAGPSGNVAIERLNFGSGTPARFAPSGVEMAHHVVDGLYHVPNYLPGYPTAATIWPREVPVSCVTHDSDGSSSCDGYRVLPDNGRGEYIFFRPTVKIVAPPKEAAPQQQVLPISDKKPLG